MLDAGTEVDSAKGLGDEISELLEKAEQTRELLKASIEVKLNHGIRSRDIDPTKYPESHPRIVCLHHCIDEIKRMTARYL